MTGLAWWLVVLVAALHVAFMVLEIFAWKRLAARVAGLVEPVLSGSERLGWNQGVYNGFLAAGLIWSLFFASPPFSRQLALFFLGCVVVAGVFGGLTIKPINRGLLVLQALPAFVALILVW